VRGTSRIMGLVVMAQIVLTRLDGRKLILDQPSATLATRKAQAMLRRAEFLPSLREIKIVDHKRLVVRYRRGNHWLPTVGG
jgi:ABC-type hemin transport system ATPase subunit